MKTRCSVKNPWHFLCFNIFPTSWHKVFLGCISVIIMVSNMASLALQMLSFQKAYDKNKTFGIHVIAINLQDIVCAIPFILLLSADTELKRKSLQGTSYWNSSKWCWIICFFKLFVMVSSHMNMSFLAFSRLNIVEHPTESKCKHFFFVAKINSLLAILAFLTAFVTTLLIWVEHFVSQSAGLMDICSPFVDPTHKAIIIKIVCCLYLCVAFCTVSFVICTYSKLYLCLKESENTLKDCLLKNRSNKPIRRR